MLRLLVCSTVASVVGFSAAACPEGQVESCLGPICGCVDDGLAPFVPDPTNPLGPIEPLLDESETYERARAEANNFVKTLPEETAHVVKDALDSTATGVRDTVNATVKAAEDIVDAVATVVRFGGRQLRDDFTRMSEAQRRIEEGKYIDAVWHWDVDRAKSTEENANLAVHENEIVDTAANAVVTYYFGPAGAAAYASWKAYHDSDGDVGYAVKVGILAYATSAGYADVNAMPGNTAGDVLKKAALTGAISGVAVSASGGSDEDALNAFLQSGGAVIVQSGQSYLKSEASEAADTESLAAEADGYCVTMSGATCSEIQGYVEEAKAYAEAAERLSSEEPNVVFTSDGDWAISWIPKAEADQEVIPPPVVLTYVGAGSPYFEEFEKLAQATGKELNKATPLGWVYLGQRISTGEWIEPRSGSLVGAQVAALAGSEIRLNQVVNRRTGPPEGCNRDDYRPIVGTADAGSNVRIVRVKRLKPGCSNYIWAQIETVQ